MLRAPPVGTAPGLAPGLNPAPRAATPAGAALNGSALVGLLARLALSDRPAAPPSLVEGLGHWLGWRDAIAVSAVLQAAPAAAPAGRGVPVSSAAAQHLQDEVRRVGEALARRIDDALHEEPDDGLDFLPHRRRYFRAQQAMEQGLAPLRQQARALLARGGPALAQLAALDAAVGAALAPREQALLAQLPVLLEKHHTRLREAAAASSPAPPLQATPAWLTTFRHDMRSMLQAELELRLQPTLGLLDALRGTAPVPA